MRRTVIFVTLISLLIVVAGVSAAQDGILAPGPPESTAPEPTTPEPTIEQPSEPTTKRELPDEQERSEVERPDNKDENGPPEPEDDVRESERGEGFGKGEPGGPGDEDEEREESGGEKVTVCHKGKTLSVGAPAEPAHLGHGDSSGPC